MSIVLLEAMAAGRPVVATAVGEAPHIIEDGVEGLLVEPKDVAAMATALRRLINDAALRDRLGRCAVAKVARRFTVEQMTRAYEDIYRNAPDDACRRQDGTGLKPWLHESL